MSLNTASSFVRVKAAIEVAFQKARNVSHKVGKSRIAATHFLAQIREQMSDTDILYYEKSILGCGLWCGLGCEIKESGPIMSKF